MAPNMVYLSESVRVHLKEDVSAAVTVFPWCQPDQVG